MSKEDKIKENEQLRQEFINAMWKDIYRNGIERLLLRARGEVFDDDYEK